MNPGPARPMPHPLRNLNHHFGPFVNWVSPIHPQSRYKIHRFHLSPCLQLAKDKGKSLIVSESDNKILFLTPTVNSDLHTRILQDISSLILFHCPFLHLIHPLKTKMPDIKG